LAGQRVSVAAMSFQAVCERGSDKAVSPFSHHVGDIVPSRAKKKVIGVNTKRDIAAVKHMEPVRYLPLVCHPGKAMRADRARKWSGASKLEVSSVLRVGGAGP